MFDVAAAVAKLLTQISHRTEALCPLPWIVFQRWETLLFASWPVAPEVMRACVPEPLEIDTFDGTAWLTIVPMHMRDLHVRDLPPIPGTSTFPEINLRTYVKVGGRPGVYFFSIECNAPFADLVANLLFDFPYKPATMNYRVDGPSIAIDSARGGGSANAANFSAKYQPVGDAFTPAPGSLEDFLLSRFASFSVANTGAVLRGDLHHDVWTIRRAQADISVNSLAKSAGIDVLDRAPQLFYSQGTDTVVWPLVEQIPAPTRP
jgi:uncharacterized protein YqjF (DUF2071 family)